MDAQIAILVAFAFLFVALLLIRFRSKLTWRFFIVPALFALPAAAYVFSFNMTDTTWLGSIWEKLSAYVSSFSMLDGLILGMLAFGVALAATLLRRKIISGLRRVSSLIRPVHAVVIVLAGIFAVAGSREILQRTETAVGYDRDESEKFSDELQSFVGGSEEKVMVELRKKGYTEPRMKTSDSWWSMLSPPHCAPQQFTKQVAMDKAYIIDFQYDVVWCADWKGEVIWITGKVSHPGSVFH